MEWMALFEISLERANQLYTWGWRLSAIGAVITMIGVALLWTGTRVRDQDFEEQVASLYKSASASEERAKLIARDAAAANERAAELQAENLALQAVLAPRNAGILGVDGPARANEWFAGLEVFSGTKVLIQAASDDREANNLAFQVSLALSARGWKPSLITEERSNARQIREGVSVLYLLGKPGSQNGPEQPWLAWKNAADALAVALTKANLGVGDLPVSSTGFVENPRMNPLGPRFDPPLDGVYLQVGPRPIGLTLQWLAKRRAERAAQPR